MASRDRVFFFDDRCIALKKCRGFMFRRCTEETSFDCTMAHACSGSSGKAVKRCDVKAGEKIEEENVDRDVHI